MYSVSGIALDNEGAGWRLMAPSRPLSELVKRAQNLTVPGRDGIVPLPSVFESPAVAFVVRTPKAQLETLYALFLQPSPTLALTSSPWRSVAFEYLSASINGVGPADNIVDVTFLVRLNGVFWRDTDKTISDTVTLDAASVDVTVFPGMSAPIRDAMIRIEGAATGLQVTDSNGSFFSYPASIPASTYLRFQCETGEAFTTSTDVWFGGTEVTGLIVNGPGPYPFEITPTFDDPSMRVGKLTVTTDTRTSTPHIEVRGRGAYLV